MMSSSLYRDTVLKFSRVPGLMSVGESVTVDVFSSLSQKSLDFLVEDPANNLKSASIVPPARFCRAPAPSSTSSKF